MNAVLRPAASASHPSEQKERGRPMSPSRIAVEAAMRTGTVANPLTAEQIAAQSGVHVTLVRTHAGNACNKGRAHNTNAGSKPARYAWGGVPSTTPARPPRTVNPHHYDGRELQPFCGRPGAMDAFDLPSLQNGERVARKPPAIISAAPEVRR